MTAEAREEHRWLQQIVGEWTFESEAACEPGQPPETFSGSESVRSLGDLWLLCEGRGEMPGGGTAITLMTLGYDQGKARFVGTWVGSMMTWLWVYDGSLDPERKVLTLETKGPSFSEGKLAKYRDVIELRSYDHRVLTSHVLGEDGTWRGFMTAHYRRR